MNNVTMAPIPEFDTAQNKDNSGDQQILNQPLSAGVVRAVQLIPSGEVITLLPVPEVDTAQNKDNSGDQQILCQLLSAGVVRVVQLIPSGEVITLLPVPEYATAQNKDNSGEQQILFQPLSSTADGRAVQTFTALIAVKRRNVLYVLTRFITRSFYQFRFLDSHK